MSVQLKFLSREADGTLTEADMVAPDVPTVHADLSYKGTQYMVVAVIDPSAFMPSRYVIAFEAAVRPHSIARPSTINLKRSSAASDR